MQAGARPCTHPCRVQPPSPLPCASQEEGNASGPQSIASQQEYECLVCQGHSEQMLVFSGNIKLNSVAKHMILFLLCALARIPVLSLDSLDCF